MTTNTHDPSEALRRIRRKDLVTLASRAAKATAVAEDTIDRRDTLLEESQGPRSEGKFTYTELSEITGLSRTRLTQIIGPIRKARRL